MEVARAETPVNITRTKKLIEIQNQRTEMSPTERYGRYQPKYPRQANCNVIYCLPDKSFKIYFSTLKNFKLLKIMKAKNHINREVISIPPWESLGKAKALMRSGNFRHLPVVDEGKLVGILSDSDIRCHGHLDATIDQAMTPNPLTIESTVTLEQAARLMLERKVNALPVLANKRLVGIISTSDIVAAFLAAAKSNEIAELLRRPIGHGHMDF